MKIRFISTLAAVALMSVTAGVNAASISLLATSPVDNVAPGDTVSFDVVLDFTDYANGTIGGGFDIGWDSSVLSFLSLNYIEGVIGSDPGFSRPPDVLDGLLESWTLSAFNPLDTAAPAVIGSVAFQVLPTLGPGTTQVFTQATQGIGGPWVDGTTFGLMDPQPEYSARDVTGVIPVPAAVWFMLSGLGALFGVRRRA